MSKIIVEHDKTLKGMKALFTELLSNIPKDKEVYTNVLRNQSSFASIITSDDFLETIFQEDLSAMYFKTIKNICLKIRKWIFYFFRLNHIKENPEKTKELFLSGMKFTDKDFFGQKYSIEISDGEYDLDNILI